MHRALLFAGLAATTTPDPCIINKCARAFATKVVSSSSQSLPLLRFLTCYLISRHLCKLIESYLCANGRRTRVSIHMQLAAFCQIYLYHDMFAFGVFLSRRAKWTRVRKMKTCPRWNSQHLTNLRLREDQSTGTLCSRAGLLLLRVPRRCV